MVESNGQRSAAAGLFRVPGLFVRLSSSSKGGGVGAGNAAVDPDSVWSPTSPLDLKNLRSSPPRVGLGLVDALTADETGALRLGGRSSFLDSIRPFLDLALPKSKTGAAAAGVATTTTTTLLDEEVSDYDADCEEYTCVIARGANPRTTHILAGGTVEVRSNGAVGGGGGCGKKVLFSIVPLSDDQQPSTSSSPPGAASGRCCCCMKRLPEDRDIFMYLGEKAFCSDECRRGYIEEEIEDAEELITLEPGLVNL